LQEVAKTHSECLELHLPWNYSPAVAITHRKSATIEEESSNSLINNDLGNIQKLGLHLHEARITPQQAKIIRRPPVCDWIANRDPLPLT
jgi:hypothetical protein